MIRALMLFKVFEPGVDHFFDPMQLCAPGILGVIESLIDSVEPSVHMRAQIDKPGIEIAQPRVVNEDSHEYGDRGNTDGEGDLNGLVSHRCFQNTLSTS